MKNIIFNKNDYYSLAVQVRSQYENLGDDVYALKASNFRIDTGDLPKWLSISQYNANKRLIGSSYILVTRGFNQGIVKLMQLNYIDARGIKTNFATEPIPKGTIISEETFYRLPPADKIKYNKVVKNSKVIYVSRGVPSVNIPNLARAGVRPPTVGTKKIPIGRWVEVQ
jgi:hypothetical protein